MSGQNTQGNKWSRRKFVGFTSKSAGAILVTGVSGCLKKNANVVPCDFEGVNSSFGHIIRGKVSRIPKYTLQVPILIVGGGVSGLTVGYHLWKEGIKDFLLLDNSDKIGGNAISGNNQYSDYPLGAHYLTLPNLDNVDLINFLNDNGYIVGFDNDGLPEYNEQDLCHAPQERLFIKNKWQEGLVPHYGIDQVELQQITTFFQYIDKLKDLKDGNGSYVFNIPISKSSFDDEWLKLDNITFKQWLLDNNYSSEALFWFLNYGTKDDYGTIIDDISALVGLHYFAARRGAAANGVSNTILTWPEGNNKLVRTLSNNFNDKIKSTTMVLDIDTSGDQLRVTCVDGKSMEVFEVVCDDCVLATPQYINNRLLENTPEYTSRTVPTIEYSPWIVANIILNNWNEDPSFVPLCWDNVIYGSDSIGYVYAQHQNMEVVHGPKVITWYYPITHKLGKDARNFLANTDNEFWKNKIINDLEMAHPGIADKIMNIKLWEWGHAMVKPLPGTISNLMKLKSKYSLQNRVHFCHSDLSGISLFEEAFYHGKRTSKQIIKKYTY